MIAATQEIGSEKLADIVSRDVAVSNALVANGNLDQRLEPTRAPGTVAHQADSVTVPLGNASDLECNLVGSYRYGGRLARDVDRDSAHEWFSRAAATIESKRSAVTRP